MVSAVSEGESFQERNVLSNYVSLVSVMNKVINHYNVIPMIADSRLVRIKCISVARCRWMASVFLCVKPKNVGLPKVIGYLHLICCSHILV